MADNKERRIEVFNKGLREFKITHDPKGNHEYLLPGESLLVTDEQAKKLLVYTKDVIKTSDKKPIENMDEYKRKIVELENQLKETKLVIENTKKIEENKRK
jgi:Viral A-type inclusion protein repeat